MLSLVVFPKLNIGAFVNNYAKNFFCCAVIVEYLTVKNKQHSADIYTHTFFARHVFGH